MIPRGHATHSYAVKVAAVRTVSNVVAITHSASEYDIGRCCRLANEDVEIAMVGPREVIQIARSTNVTSGEIVCNSLDRRGIHAAGTTVEVAEPSYMVIYTPTVTGGAA